MATTAPAEFSMQRSHTYGWTGPVRWVWSHARRYWWNIIMMIIGSVGNAGLVAAVPVLTGDAFNEMRKPKPDTSALHFISTSFGFFSFSATKRIPEEGLFLRL